MRLGLLRKRIVMVCLALSFTFPVKALASTDMEVLSYDENVSPGNVLEPDHSYGDGELGEAVQTDEEKRTNGVELQQDAVYTSESFNDLIYEVTAEGAIKIIDYVGSAEYLEIPDNINGKQVVSIGDKAFDYCTSLKEVRLPNSVLNIGDNVFDYCTNLSILEFPDQINSIGKLNFQQTNITEVKLPNGILEINDYAFHGAQSLIKINIPDSVKRIGKNAFYHSQLDVIKIPNSVTSIGDNAFEYCNNLSELIIPDSVVNIGRDIFSYCNNLTKIYFPKKIDSLGDWNCIGLSELIEIRLPYGITEIPENAFEGCAMLTSVNIPESVTIIEQGAFRNCNVLSEITIPSSVRRIGYGAFDVCGLNVLNITGDVARYLSYPFYSLQELKEINIKDGVSEIEDRAFWNCGWDTIITIPKSVTEIGEGVFGNCFIRGTRGSYAETYAQNNKITFVSLQDEIIEEYTVSSSDEFLEALGSYRHIVLKDGIYKISEGLNLSHLVSVSIEAENPGKVEILSKYNSPVVTINNSTNIRLKGCILGHSAFQMDPSGCGPEAYVIYSEYSSNVEVLDCDLYGCGIEGLGYVGNDITIKDCIIRDCMRRITSGNGNNINFINCIISGNAYDEVYASEYCAVTGPVNFNGCIFLNNFSTIFQTEDNDKVSLNNCVFSDNAWNGMQPEAYGICLNGITWQVDGNYLKIGYPLILDDGTIVESAKGKIINYSEISLPWKKYMDKERILADGIEDKVAVEQKFEDVKASEWYVSAVQYVYDYGIMKGKTEENFEPNNNLTRAEFATVLHNLESKPTIGYQALFSDVKEGQWYTSPILWAYEKEIVSGYPNGKYGVADKIQREQLALILYKYAKLKGYDMSSQANKLFRFTDEKSISSWAKEAMRWAVTHGIMSGKGNSSDLKNYRLDPKGYATRAECASMIMKLFTM